MSKIPLTNCQWISYWFRNWVDDLKFWNKVLQQNSLNCNFITCNKICLHSWTRCKILCNTLPRNSPSCKCEYITRSGFLIIWTPNKSESEYPITRKTSFRLEMLILNLERCRYLITYLPAFKCIVPKLDWNHPNILMSYAISGQVYLCPYIKLPSTDA